MINQRTLGLILLVGGVVLFVVGMNSSDSVADQFSEFFTGRYTDATNWYLFGGIAAGIVGLGLLSFGGRLTRKS
jgi:hypothetical protein